MRVYTVHVRPSLPDDPDIVLVKEGISWPGFFFAPLWLLWHRLWGAFFLLLAVEVALALAFSRLLSVAPIVELAASLGISVLVGLEGPELRRAKLARQGHAEHGPIAADDFDLAEEIAVRRLAGAKP
ncbi:MAG: DUF2628 domain-containing protein [Alphaproteobacteria bacterium]|nr:DUF2628 domain-containing protein [Alphaproteobacteria bacterium]